MQYSKLIILLLVIFLADIFPQTQFNPFVFTGSKVGEMVNSEAKTVYFIVDYNKLLKTKNYFQTYDTLFTYPGNIYGRYNIYVDTSYSPADRIILKGNNGAYISLDGGENWNPFINSGMYAFANNKIYMINGTTLQFSSDNGATWQTSNAPALSGGAGYLKLFMNNNSMFISTYRFGYERWERFYISNNNGVSWSSIFLTIGTEVPCQFMDVKFLENSLFASSYCESKSYLYRIPEGTLSTMIKRGDNITIDRNGYLYVMDIESIDPVIFRLNISTNQGQTWKKESIINTGVWQIEDVLVDDQGYIYVSYRNGLYRSNQSGYPYFTTDTISFGKIKLNNTISRDVTFRNPFNYSISIDSLSFSIPSFSVNNFTPLILPAHDSISYSIKFTPAAFDTTRGTATFYIGSSLKKLGLAGISPRPNISGLPLNITFDGIRIDSTATRQLVIKNQSINSLKISSIALAGNNAFSLENYNFPVEIAPADSFVHKVYFKPIQVLNYFDTLIIRSNGVDSIKKIGLQGINVITNIADKLSVPEFNLYQNYPNPFNPSSTITFELAKEGPVSLTIFDVNGEQAAVLINEKKTAGVHQIVFNSNGLASGLYFCRLISGNYHKIIKMVVLK